MAAEPGQRRSETAERVIERDVVIARHDDLRPGQAIEKRSCLAELPVARPLCQIARHGHDVRRQVGHGVDQCGDDFRIGGAEVEIGNVRDRPHQAGLAAGRGTST